MRDLEKYHYMSAAKSEDFERLGQILRPRAGSEAAFLIDNLVVKWATGTFTVASARATFKR